METANSRIPTRRYTEPFRSRRFQSNAFVDGLTISIDDTSLGKRVGSGKNISVRGIKALFPREADKSVKDFAEGDCIGDAKVSYYAVPVFSGSGYVRHVSVDGDKQVVGLELVGADIAFDQIYDTTLRLSFKHRMQHVIDQCQGIDKSDQLGFRAWAEHCKVALQCVRDALNAEERKLRKLDLGSKFHATSILRKESYALFLPIIHLCRKELNRRVEDMTPQESTENQRIFREVLGELLFESTFIARAYEKPFGYPGDYELMNILYRSRPEDPTIFADLLTQHGKTELAGRATINRLEYLGTMIEETVRLKAGERAHIASIGCGAAREIYSLLSKKPELGNFLDITLFDQESKALEVCEKTLLPFSRSTGAKFSFIGDPIQSLMKEKNLGNSLGKKDLVYSIGLYDYLDDSTFVGLSAALYDIVNPGGRLVVGNIASHNPSRHWMEYSADWFLVYRSKADLAALAGNVAKPRLITVDSEPAGINLFLHIKKNDLNGIDESKL